MAGTMPLYAGIDGLAAEGQWVQWGGARLGGNGFPNMPEGRAKFSLVEIPTPRLPAGKFMLATRRGKQVNSMTYGQKDPNTAVRRRDVGLFHAGDLKGLGPGECERLLVRRELGPMEAAARSAPSRPRHPQ